MHDDPDFELVQAMVAGDPQALEDLYIRHGSSLLIYLVGQLGQRELAEEVLQDVMLAAWQAAPRFRGESQVRTWLFSIARHRALNARRRSPAPDAMQELDRLAGDSQPADLVEQQDTLESIARAIRELPEEQRETVELVFFHELSGPEVAEIMGVAPGTVKSRLHRAKATLRKWLNREEGARER